MDRLLQIIQSDTANKTCIDCNAPHPQWASVNNGVFFCLECSGKHRGLGVQVSFVRSVTMDRWTPVQIKHMEAGGNAKARKFWKQWPEYVENMDIRAKYNSEFAQCWRRKLAADVEGRVYEPMPPSRKTSPTEREPARVSSTTPSVSSSYYSIQEESSQDRKFFGADEEDDDWFSKFKGYAKNIGGQLHENILTPAANAVKNSQFAQKAVEYIKTTPITERFVKPNETSSPDTNGNSHSTRTANSHSTRTTNSGSVTMRSNGSFKNEKKLEVKQAKDAEHDEDWSW